MVAPAAAAVKGRRDGTAAGGSRMTARFSNSPASPKGLLVKHFHVAAVLAAVSACAIPLSAQPAPRISTQLESVAVPVAETALATGSAPDAAARVSAALAADTAATGAQVVVGALMGGAAGMVAGAYTGMKLEQAFARRCYASEMCGLRGWLLGGFAGGSAGMAAGAHLLNGANGNLPAGMAATLGVGVGTLLIAGALSSQMEAGAGAVLLAVPVAQVFTAVSVERSTARRRLAHR